MTPQVEAPHVESPPLRSTLRSTSPVPMPLSASPRRATGTLGRYSIPPPPAASAGPPPSASRPTEGTTGTLGK
eukprot:scaffold3826_cov78-Phaeocystis_antarctica.AAC.4